VKVTGGLQNLIRAMSSRLYCCRIGNCTQSARGLICWLSLTFCGIDEQFLPVNTLSQQTFLCLLRLFLFLNRTSLASASSARFSSGPFRSEHTFQYGTKPQKEFPSKMLSKVTRTQAWMRRAADVRPLQIRVSGRLTRCSFHGRPKTDHMASCSREQ
jgi:hypothetical protein